MRILPLLPPAMSRRIAIAAGLILPFGAKAAADEGDDKMREADATHLARRAADANRAFISGDMRRWYELASPIGCDFTLMAPFGGTPSYGFDGSAVHLDALARRFTGGQATFELVERYASGEMVVLAFIERQRVLVGGLPEQDWSLRVTQVYARRDGEWHLVHRHADPLTHDLTIAQAASIARGEFSASSAGQPRRS